MAQKKAQDSEMNKKLLCQKRSNSRSDGGKDVGFPVPQLVWIKRADLNFHEW